MRLSKLFTKTQKEVPSEETARNAQLLIRAGYIHKELAGVYAYLPLGKMVLDKITTIVREEMNEVGGQEIQLTALQPKELWEKTGRWDDSVVDIWFKTSLRSGGELGLGMSHEEPLTDLLRSYMKSYQDLPSLIYQFQTKFRNELRAKSGLLRGREFLMKDMYSFASTEAEHQELFSKVKRSYERIFERLGIADKIFYTTASGGEFSEDFSYEFQALTSAGEDTIYLDRDKKLAVNQEIMSDEVLAKLGLNKDNLEEVRGCELANIFNLGTKYSEALGLTILNKENKQSAVIMGCYGIGVSRAMGVITELLSDDKGLVWPEDIAPAKVYLISIGEDKQVIEQADELYKNLTDNGVEVLYDDRSVHPGEKFADADLIGIPYRLVISPKTVPQQKVELKRRSSQEVELVGVHRIVEDLSLKP